MTPGIASISPWEQMGWFPSSQSVMWNPWRSLHSQMAPIEGCKMSDQIHSGDEKYGRAWSWRKNSMHRLFDSRWMQRMKGILPNMLPAASERNPRSLPASIFILASLYTLGTTTLSWPSEGWYVPCARLLSGTSLDPVHLWLRFHLFLWRRLAARSWETPPSIDPQDFHTLHAM